MRRDPDDESWSLIAYLLGLVALSMLAFYSISVMQERQAQCERQHQIYELSRTGGDCLEKPHINTKGPTV